MPDNYISGEARHQAALDYIRQRARTRDAALEGAEPDDDSDSHVHIHLHRSEGDLPPSAGNANPPAGKSSGAPVRVSSDGPNPLSPPTARAGKFGRDEEGDPDEGEGEGEEAEQVIGQLPEPGEGMVYRLDPQPDGSVAVVLCQDDGGEIQVNENDNLRSIGDARSRQIMDAMNRKNRAFWTRDSVGSATIERTIFTHTPAENERLEIRKVGNHFSLILISPSVDLTGPRLPGTSPQTESSEEDGDITGENSAAAAGEPRMERSIGGGKIGDSPPRKLKSMNEANRRFWSRGAA